MRRGDASWGSPWKKRKKPLQIEATSSGDSQAIIFQLIASGAKFRRRVHVLHPYLFPSDQDDDCMQREHHAFSKQDWQRHKSMYRYHRHFLSIRGSKLLTTLAPVILSFTTIAGAVVTWNHLVLQGALPGWAHILASDPLGINLTAPVLSLCLAFRTNTSYQRFCEANKMWGDMLQRIRDLARQALTYMDRRLIDGDGGRRALFLRYLQAFLITLKHHMLENGGDLERELLLAARLSKDEVASLMCVKHRPIHVLHMLSMCINSCDMHSTERLLMDLNVTCLMDNVGACERIFKTPVPEMYTKLLARFVSTWLVWLPFALWNSCQRMVVPIVLLVSTVLLCIDQIGVTLEEPFGHLPLNDVVATACRDVKEMASRSTTARSVVAPVLTTEGWLPLSKDMDSHCASQLSAVSELCRC